MSATSNGIKQHSAAAFRVIAPSVVALGCGLALLQVVRRSAAALVRGAPLGAADALVAALALVGVLGIAWVLLGVCLELLARGPGALGRSARQLSRAVSPLVVRRAVGLALGAGVGVGLSGGGAHALPPGVVAVVQDVATRAVATDPTPAANLPDPGWTATPDPGWTPQAPPVRSHPDLAVLGARSRAAEPDEVVVHRGDTLWGIAARALGPDATDTEIAGEWPRWYAANRAVIGDDPDLIRPGQVLLAPGAEATR